MLRGADTNPRLQGDLMESVPWRYLSFGRSGRRSILDEIYTSYFLPRRIEWASVLNSVAGW